MEEIKECVVCGRKNPLKGANYCYYCGASFREMNFVPEDLKKHKESAAELKTNDNGTGFSMWKWLGLFALLLLPPYGWICFIVLLCVIAFGPKATEERRNFAKAFLIFILAAVVLLYLLMSFVQSNPDLMAQYNEILQKYQAVGQ